MNILLPALPAFEEVEQLHFGREHKLEQVQAWVWALHDRLTAKAGRERLREAVKAHAMSGSDGEADAIAAAQTWREADYALRELVVELEQSGRPIPTALGTFRNAALFRPITPAGEGAEDAFLNIFLRDIAIFLLVTWAGAHWRSLKPTRSTASEHASACSLVSEAMTRAGVKGCSEPHVARIYKQHGKIAERLTAWMPPRA